MKRPLVIVTRPKAQARPVLKALKKAGFKAVAIPTIRIMRPRSYRKLDAAINLLPGFDGVVFTSRNAVEGFFARADGRPLSRPRLLFAVGAETARALAERGWRRAKTPSVHRAEGLVKAIGKVRGLNLLLPRAAVARELLPAVLRRRGARLAVVEVYRTMPERGSKALLARSAKKGIAAVTFSSGSTVDQFVALFGKARSRRLFESARAVSIGPVTSQALRAHKIVPDVQAAKATADGLVRAVVSALKER